MSHVARRLQEIKANPPQRKAKKPRKPRTTPIRVKPTDADTLRHIAAQIRRAGMKNFAAELERIAAESLPSGSNT